MVVEGAGKAPLALSDGQSLLPLAEVLIVEAQRWRMTESLSALDERTVRLIREILDVRVGPGQTVYLARYPIETCPPLVDGEPEHEFVPVIMRTTTLAIQNDSISDEEFTRRARETLRQLMGDTGGSFFVYRLIVGPTHGEAAARAWRLRYARHP